MCSYCGCRALTEIGALSEEHEQLVNALGDLRRLLSRGGTSPVARRTGVERLAALLLAHTAREEQGLFAELAGEEEFTAHRRDLLDDHDVVELCLGRLQAGDDTAIESLERELRRHIDREENGLFPAVAVSLDWDAWARIEQRRAAGSNDPTGAPATGASWVA